MLGLKDRYPEVPVTVFLRNKTLDTYLSDTAGVKRIVHGTFDEKDKIIALAKEHDIVINVGSSWDVPLSEALVEGLNQQPDDKKKTLIHMSGTGNFVDKRWKDGAFHSEAKVWNVRVMEFLSSALPDAFDTGRKSRGHEADQPCYAQWWTRYRVSVPADSLEARD